MTHTVSRTHDTLAHVLDASGRRVSRHDVISDAYAEAERLNSKETTMPVETSETLAMTVNTEKAVVEKDAAYLDRMGYRINAARMLALMAERDAANAARLTAEGERDRLREALRKIAGISNECTWAKGTRKLAGDLQDIIRAALTPAPEAPKDGE